MRSWRRGTKEMDLILGPYADARLPAMSEAELLAYEAMLNENDQDLYAWITGQQPMPESLLPVLGPVREHHQIG
ncbi:succinate dehydrogenase assembly factor 2 [Halovulum sp. GXIMD14794]